jgi:hypothetical protein
MEDRIRVELIENKYTQSKKKREVIVMSRKPIKGEILDLGEENECHYYYKIKNLVYNYERNSYKCVGHFEKVYLGNKNEGFDPVKFLFNNFLI